MAPPRQPETLEHPVCATEAFAPDPRANASFTAPEERPIVIAILVGLTGNSSGEQRHANCRGFGEWS
jgi:hypothetical protein